MDDIEQMEKVSDEEWEKRILCSDESCIGIIGSDGRCKECGMAYQGDLPDAFSNHASSDDMEASSDDEFPDDDHEQEALQGQGTSGDDWDNRVLCSDGGCIGVIGPDGRCKECGLPYKFDEPTN